MAERTYLILDIETIPDKELFTPADPPSGSERPMPPVWAHQPIVIGVMWLDEKLVCKRIGIIGEGKDEAGMLADMAEFTRKHRPEVVTWNGRGFDLPVLMQRAMRHGLSFPWYFRSKGYRYRFSEEGHLDLCDQLSDFGAVRHQSLDATARLVGLPGKGGVDGSQVEGLFHAGQIEALRRYCLSDVAQTAFIFLRFLLLAGDLDRSGYRHAAGALLDACQADPRLAEFAVSVDRPRLLLEDAP